MLSPGVYGEHSITRLYVQDLTYNLNLHCVRDILKFILKLFIFINIFLSQNIYPNLNKPSVFPPIEIDTNLINIIHPIDYDINHPKLFFSKIKSIIGNYRIDFEKIYKDIHSYEIITIKVINNKDFKLYFSGNEKIFVYGITIKGHIPKVIKYPIIGKTKYNQVLNLFEKKHVSKISSKSIRYETFDFSGYSTPIVFNFNDKKILSEISINYPTD